VPADKYHRRPGVSSSSLRDFISSPAVFHRRHVLKADPPPASSSLERGTHVHRFVEVGEEQFRAECHVWPADLLTASGARSTSSEAKKWVASLPKGATILNSAELESITEQCHRILENTAARDLLEQVQWREFVVTWEQEGTPMRCRGDAATPDFWIDLKTTSKPDVLETWWRSVKDFKYHVQAAVYGWAARAAGWPDHDVTCPLEDAVAEL